MGGAAASAAESSSDRLKEARLFASRALERLWKAPCPSVRELDTQKKTNRNKLAWILVVPCFFSKESCTSNVASGFTASRFFAS
jgi:hypothetical protein